MLKNLVTVGNSLILAILDGAPISEDQKLRVMDELGTSSVQIRDVNGRTSIIKLARLWKKIIALTNNEFIGLHIGNAVDPEKFGMAVHAAQNSKDFRQVLLRFTDHARLINDLIVCHLEETTDKAIFSMKFYWDVFGLERHAVDITFASILKWTQIHLGRKLPIQEVRFRHPYDQARNEYERIFEAPITFGARGNEIIFESSILNLNIPAANLELGTILNHYAKSEVTKVPALSDLPARVSQLIRNELESRQSVDLSTMADLLKTTTRNLQRQLSDSSTSFSLILDDTRKAMAPALLTHPLANVEQVGIQLGYAEPTAFIRAFKKWYGITPGEYRKQKAE